MGVFGNQTLDRDHDQGQSGPSAVDREGFQKLVAEVGVGHAGLVIGLEVSRLARKSSDWYHLLEICAFTDTLILVTLATQGPSCMGAARASAGHCKVCSRSDVPQEKWHTLLRNAHPGYIGWDEYHENQRRLQENAHALGPERRKSPPREGPALLQGLVICGICGERMNMKVIYHVRAGRRVPDYLCDGRTVNDPQPMCQWISGKDVDEAVGDLLLEIVTPSTKEKTAITAEQRCSDCSGLR